MSEENKKLRENNIDHINIIDKIKTETSELTDQLRFVCEALELSKSELDDKDNLIKDLNEKVSFIEHEKS